MGKTLSILIIPAGYVPIYSANPGGVEKLIELFLEANETLSQHNIIVCNPVFSHNKNSSPHHLQYSKLIPINKATLVAKFWRTIFSLFSKIHFLPYWNFFLLQAIRQSKCHNNHYDLVIVENAPMFLPAVRKHFPKSKVVLHLHNDYLNAKTPRAIQNARSADFFFGVSQFILDRITTIPGIHKDRLKLLYNGTDTAPIISRQHKKQELKAELGFKQLPTAFFAGRIFKGKGVLELVNATLAVNKAMAGRLQLIIAGAPRSRSLSDSVFLSRLRKKIRLDANIHYVEHQSSSDLEKLYRLSDFQIVPSIVNEAFGLVGIEAARHGLPIIATSSGALPEVLQSVKSVTLIDRQNLTENLIIAISNMLKTTPHTEHINDLTQFSSANYVEEFDRLLRSVTQ